MFRGSMKEEGYTLIEVLIQLLLIGTILPFLALFYNWIQWADEQMKPSLGWELFLAEIQQQLESIIVSSEGEAIQIQSSGKMIQFETERGIITIEQQQNVIRKKTIELGHVPMLTNVKQVEFIQLANRLKIKVEFQTGEWKERIVVYGILQE